MKAHYRKDLIVDNKYMMYWKISVCGSPEGAEITMFKDIMLKHSTNNPNLKKWYLTSIRGNDIITNNLKLRTINQEICKCILYNNKVNYQKRFEIW